MTTPYTQQPTDRYSTDGISASENLEWQVHQPKPSPLVPYVTMPGTPAPDLAGTEARRQQRAITLRMMVALTMAVPLTAMAMASTSHMGGLTLLLSIGLTWVGIAVVVYLSHGKGLPRARR